MQIGENIFSFSRIKKEQIDQLTDLFNQARDRKIQYSFFQKKYNTKWSDDSLHGVILTDDNNQLVGYCGTTLYKIQESNRNNFKIGQLGDLLMMPNIQGKGYFKKLLNHLEEETVKRKIDGLVVFPNKNANPIFQNREGWISLGCFIDYAYTVKTYPLLKIFNKLGIQKWFLSVSSLFGSSKLAKSDWTKVNRNKIHIPASHEYFIYKQYQSFKFHSYQSKEFLWSLSDGILINGSQVESISELNAEIEYLKRFCKIRGIHQFRYICHDRSLLGSLIIKTELMEINRSPIFYKSFNQSINPENIVFQGIDRNAF